MTSKDIRYMRKFYLNEYVIKRKQSYFFSHFSNLLIHVRRLTNNTITAFNKHIICTCTIVHVYIVRDICFKCMCMLGEVGNVRYCQAVKSLY